MILTRTWLLYLANHEIAWRRFEAIENFCLDQRLIFSCRAGSAPGAFGPERVVFDGSTVRSFAAYDNDEIMLLAETVCSQGNFTAAMAHLAAAELEIPPFRAGGSIGGQG